MKASELKNHPIVSLGDGTKVGLVADLTRRFDLRSD